ncbi:MAG: phospholipase, partial [Chitinophagia bacterium]|nr:phospholipase [Chitinophagia bacterium]
MKHSAQNNGKILLLLALVWIGFSTMGIAQSQHIVIKKQFVITKNSKTDTLQYQVHLPDNFEPAKKYPLLVMLHGSGERGSDNEVQYKHFAPFVENPTIRSQHPAIILIPQCPKSTSWSWWIKDRDTLNYTLKPNPTPALQAFHALLKQIEKDYKIDSDKRYITGLSMGGLGTLEYLGYYPAYFAAAAPVCGGGDTKKVRKIRRTPVWLFHGGSDRVVVPRMSRMMYKALMETDAEVVYTEWPGIGHDSWVQTYQQVLLADW